MQPHNLCLLAESRSAGPGLVQQRTARGAAVGGYAGSTAQSLSDTVLFAKPVKVADLVFALAVKAEEACRTKAQSIR